MLMRSRQTKSEIHSECRTPEKEMKLWNVLRPGGVVFAEKGGERGNYALIRTVYHWVEDGPHEASQLTPMSLQGQHTLHE